MGGAPPKRQLSLARAALKDSAAAEFVALLGAVTEDGSVTLDEARRLEEWLNSHPCQEFAGVTYIRTILATILEDGNISPPEESALYKAIERLLPPAEKQKARERRMAFEDLQRERARAEQKAMKEAARTQCESLKPLATSNFMVAGVLHENRAYVVEHYLDANDTVYLAREANNEHDANAVQVRLRGGQLIGYMPREDAATFAPFLDSGCRQAAHVTKILNGQRGPIPIVDAELYRADADIPGSVLPWDVPARDDTLVTRIAPAGQSSSASCLYVLVLILAFAVLAFCAQADDLR